MKGAGWRRAALAAGLALAAFAARWACAQAAVPAAAPASAASVACTEPPLPGVTLYLRGGMNSWAPVDEYAFQWRCDAYWLNVDLRARQEFKIADADWSPATNFGEGPPGEEGALQLGGGNAARVFSGEHTLRLSLEGSRARLAIGPRSFAAAPKPVLTDPVALGLRFDSRSALHKKPFGAVPERSTLDFAVQAPPGVQSLALVVEGRELVGNQDRLHYTELARVPMRAGPVRDGRQTWRARHRFDAKGVYGYWFEAQVGGQRVALQNNNQPVHWTRERGTGGVAVADLMPADTRRIRRFRQTVHDPAYRVPAWAADAVYYQIFPDRFRNGDPSNDPQPGRDRYQRGTVEKHARWLDTPFRPGSGDGSDALHNNDFFGGDLAGIVDKLDELKALGVNVLYLTPVFQAPSNHKYDTADYRRIDPAFGTEADFVRLTREAARRGMRILPDTSFNHVGADSPYFDRYGNHAALGAFEGGKPQPGSPYASWFRFDMTQADPDRQYRHWGGPDLPEVDKASPAFRAFAYGNPDSVTRHWLDRGAAGWRMDVAPWVPDDFWREWRKAVKRHRPQAITLAETWFDASKYFVGDMFDSTMNYIFRNAVLDYAAGGPAQDLAEQLEHLREAYPPQALHALMNLIGSHDVARPLHVLGGQAVVQDPAALAQAKARLKLAAFLQMTQPGAPMVYYGDEVGLTGGEDPYNRGTYPWPDLGGQPDLALRAHWQRLIAWRHAHPVLRRGRAEAPLLADDGLLVQRRQWRGQQALVAVNHTAQARPVQVAWSGRARLRPLSGGAELLPRDGRLTLTVPALSGLVAVTRTP